MEIEKKERALLVGVCLPEEKDFKLSMLELLELAMACDIDVLGTIEQKMERPDKALYIGSGKVNEVLAAKEELHADLIIFDNALSPTQIRNLTNQLICPILDRTQLILEIFGKRAKSREAKLQVEIARLQYILPRMVGIHEALSRQGGGGGSRANKGAGEKQLELDKRNVEHRISELRKELTHIRKERVTQRKKRNETGAVRVALVGYTNAGKSTLMNTMLRQYYRKDGMVPEKLVYEEDMLFATLDTTVRKINPPNHLPFLLSDTVGFISKLPHHLVEAFHSTLEETIESDLLLHVIDFSDISKDDQINVTYQTLEELGAGDIPVIYVYNKADLCMDEKMLPVIRGNRIYMSAKKGIGLTELLDLIEKTLADRYQSGEFCFPYDQGGIVSYLNQSAAVEEVSYEEQGIRMKVRMRVEDYRKYEKYLV